LFVVAHSVAGRKVFVVSHVESGTWRVYYSLSRQCFQIELRPDAKKEMHNAYGKRIAMKPRNASLKIVEAERGHNPLQPLRAAFVRFERQEGRANHVIAPSLAREMQRLDEAFTHYASDDSETEPCYEISFSISLRQSMKHDMDEVCVTKLHVPDSLAKLQAERTVQAEGDNGGGCILC
jgi:hypothetical protein